eukprot:CAMPEP_0203816094 /NCGR_PEP_ID=MMETSP0115-20131106/14334_1 /ASSEMBLY_ACC=CAM_ASM_000227 /TAXON_ID=33651 /ORGANISM="Bicosoecid sp, Strain ms1" /LENGTH=293 /DNA_ID=CAMNT_0050724993 /DNA_START=310 /DNA_END=1188 /DNA_ORIENTATION=+
MASSTRRAPNGGDASMAASVPVKFGVALDAEHSKPAWLFACVLGASLVAVYSALQVIRDLMREQGASEEEVGVPTSLDELKAAHAALQAATAARFAPMAAAFSVVYLFKQTYAIPGSAVLNLVAGATFGTAVGLPLVCVLTACGASCCYLLSWLFGGRLVAALGERIRPVTIRVETAAAQGNLFFYLLFARLFPFTPNWALNLIAPWVRVPIAQFAPSVLLGLLPYNLVLVRAGTLLEQLSSTSSALDWTTLAQMAALALLALLPTLFRGQARRLESRLSGSGGTDSGGSGAE